jgi:hypothetical protein
MLQLARIAIPEAGRRPDCTWPPILNMRHGERVVVAGGILPPSGNLPIRRNGHDRQLARRRPWRIDIPRPTVRGGIVAAQGLTNAVRTDPTHSNRRLEGDCERCDDETPERAHGDEQEQPRASHHEGREHRARRVESALLAVSGFPNAPDSLPLADGISPLRDLSARLLETPRNSSRQRPSFLHFLIRLALNPGPRDRSSARSARRRRGPTLRGRTVRRSVRARAGSARCLG